jgi:hypothetical protein
MTTGGEQQLTALSGLRLDWALAPDDVWTAFPEHVPDLHQDVARRILDGLEAAGTSPDLSPPGLVLQGAMGTGKTRLLGWTREQVLAAGGYFFLIPPTEGRTFWSGAVESILDGLSRETGDGETQLRSLLRRLASRAGSSRAIESALSSTTVSKKGLSSFVQGLVDVTGRELGGPDLQDTARALVLYASKDLEGQEVAKQYFLSTGEAEAAARQDWGIESVRLPQLLVRDLSRLLAITGPSVIAIDQIDALIAQAATSWNTVDHLKQDARRDDVVGQIADGVMALREVTRRTFSIIACRPNSWQLIKNKAIGSVPDRFRDATLATIADPDLGRALVEKRLAGPFTGLGFIPPHPTWPIAPEAFDSIVGLTPRTLLKRVAAHIRVGLDGGEIRELPHFASSPEVATGQLRAIEDAQLNRLDARFAELSRQAEVSATFGSHTEDRLLPGLLTAGLTAWIEEQADGRGYFLDAPASPRPALHARLRRTVNEEVGAEFQWAFRAITSATGRAAASRITAALTASGVRRADQSRSLILIRNAPWPKGPAIEAAIAQFAERGGVTMPISTEDLQTFAALQTLLAERDPVLRYWLATRRPAGGSDFFGVVLAEAREPGQADATPGAADSSPATNPIPVIRLPAPADTASIPFGRRVGDGRAVTVSLKSLRKHTVVFAGPGSGKTVLLRRMIEECALQGVSSVVIDASNDLARLGDPWPQTPSNWTEDDPAKAERYLAETDVVIWTPGQLSGRALSFAPLPDFTVVQDEPDEFRMAMDVACDALVPRAGADGRTRQAQQERAVLREAVKFFAAHGGGTVGDLIDLMNNLPPEVTSLGPAMSMAEEMARTLGTATVNDPLFFGKNKGSYLDPGLLLRPDEGKKARVSVISLVALSSDAQRQAFVSQLQMALFGWFKRNPSERPLGGLLVLDEAQTFAPAGPTTASTRSTLALVSQARKYGLGMLFATQAPKSLHSQISGTATTQVYGLLHGPAEIEAARELARRKGGDVPDLATLEAGEFYLAAEGTPFTRVVTSHSLSHHAGALAADEVMQRVG